MVEKPMARTWIEAERAVRAAEAHPGVYLALNDDNFYDPKYRVVRDLLAQGAIGALQHLTLIRGSNLKATSVLKAQASALDNGGGCLMDYGSHGMAGAWYVVGTRLRPIKVEAVSIGVRFPHRILEGDPCYLEVDDNAQIKVLFEDPDTGRWVTVFLEATWCGGHIGLDQAQGRRPEWRLPASAGRCWRHQRHAENLDHHHGLELGETVLPIREYRGRDHLDGNRDRDHGRLHPRSLRCPRCDVRFGADVIAIIEAAYLSALRGRAVTLDEFKELCAQLCQRIRRQRARRGGALERPAPAVQEAMTP